MMAVKGRRAAESWTATVAASKGSRTRRPAALRTESAAEHTSRTRSIPATNAASDTRSVVDGQSVRCTDWVPVRPVYTTSVVRGARGAMTRQRISRHVWSVSTASWLPAQKRSRERRMYQLVSTSRNDRTEAHAPKRS